MQPGRPSVYRVVSCAFACMLGFADRAAAETRDFVNLAWDAENACSSADDVLGAVELQLGESFDSEIRIRARGTVRVADDEFALHLEFTTTAGARDERQIRGESCAAVTSAAALVLALALDPQHASTPPEEPPPQAVAGEVGEDSEFALSVLALVDTPILDQLAYGGGLRFAYRYASLELSASAQVFLPRDQSQGDITMRLQSWSVDVGACYLFRVADWAFGPCARFEIGRLSGEPRGAVDAATPGSARTQTATLGATLRVPLWAAIRLGLDAGLEWVARRPQFEVTGEGTVASPTTFGARLVVGPVLVF